MNQPYVSTASSFEINRQKGRVPTDEVLARARQPMVLLGAAAIALMYPLGLVLGGPLAGLSAAGLALSSAFIRYTLVHAWAEAPLALFLLLAALLAAIGARKVAGGTGGWLAWGLALGGVLGLASATKLTGLVGFPIVLAVAGLLAFRSWHTGDTGTARRLSAWGTLATATALLLMVALNPFLWRGPVAGLVSMIEQRRDEMAFQQEQWPEFAVLNVADRPWLMAVGATRVGPWGDLPPVAVVVGLGLAAAGLWSLRPRLSPLTGEPATLMLVAWLGGYAIAIFGGLGLSYPRYFLPACLLLLPLMGAGIEYVFTSLRAVVRSKDAAPASPLHAKDGAEA
jgi:4-amino-4-deoxy-L-arabinose transferase-like glycosyltransferase